MRHIQRFRSWGGALTLLVVVLSSVAPDPAQAASVTYALDYIFSPATGSVSPLGTVTLTDLGTAVKFDVQNQGGRGLSSIRCISISPKGRSIPLILHFPM